MTTKDALFEMIEFGCGAALEKARSSGCQFIQLRELADALVWRSAITYLYLSEEYGGEKVYIPKKSPDLAQHIQKAFRGNNVDEIAKKFQVHRATVYRRLKKKNKVVRQDFVSELVDCLLTREFKRKEVEKYQDSIQYVFERFSASDVFKRFFKK